VITNQEITLAEGEYEEVEEGAHASSRYSSFLKKRKSTMWSIEETKEFYKVYSANIMFSPVTSANTCVYKTGPAAVWN